MGSLRRGLVIGCPLALLAGCAGQIVQRAPDNAYIRAATSATVRFEVPALLRTCIMRQGWGTLPKIGDADRRLAESHVNLLLTEARIQCIPAVESALKANGIPNGDDELIKMYVEEAEDGIYGANATMSVFVHFRDAPTGVPQWNIKIKAHNTVADSAPSTARSTCLGQTARANPSRA